MKLSQKLHSVLVSKSYLKKSMFLSLTAIGVLGGFFVAYEAIVANDEIVVDSPASGVYWNGTKTISWDTSTCSDADTVNIMLADTNGAVLTNLAVNVLCKSGNKEWNTATYPGGSYKILVQRNIEGTHQGYTGIFTTDNVAPTIATSTLISPNGNEFWGGEKKTIIWDKTSITDGNLGTKPISLYYSVGNTTPEEIATGEANDGSYEWTLPSNVDLNGVTVQIVATDLATNTSSDTSNATFKIDTVKPVVAITSLNGGEKMKGGSTQTLAWTVTGNDNTAADAEKVEYTSNGTTWVTIPLTDKVWTVPTDNTSTAKIRVSVTDLAGNIGSDESDNAFIIDSTAPKATFVSASDYFGPITFADRTFRGTVSDVNGSGVAAVKVIIRNSVNPKYWNGGSWQDNEASVAAVLDTEKANWSYVVPSALVLDDGVTYSVIPVATDVAGNEDLLATGDLLTYDSSAPLLSITIPVAETLTKTVSQTVSGIFTEPNIQTITINGSAATLTVGTFSKDISLVEGANTITVIATDKAGNYETKTVSVTLDTHAPTVAVTPLTTDNNKPVLTGTVNDNLAIVKVTVGGKEYTANIANGAWTVSTDVALADGKYNVVAIATDKAGNTGTESTTDELVVDTTDPIISVITTPVADEVFTSNTSTADVFLTFTASDVTTATTCTYQIDGTGDSSSISCAGSSIPVSDGRHTITVTAKDGVNKIASAISSSFVVNTDKKLTVGATGADFSSISTAVSKASGGDTIDVAAGEYTESVVIPTGLTGLIIKGAADKTSIIKPTGVSVLEANGTSAITVKTGSTGITIDGFTFNCDGKDYGVYSIGSGVTIQNNSISGYKKNGIFVKGGTVTIDKNIIIGSGSEDFSGDSIYTRDGATLFITNNTLTGNGFSTPPSATATGLSIHAGDTATITGNTITGNSWGIHIKGAENSAQANPKIISAENNVISGNAVANVYYENFGFAPSTGYYKMSKNWWGISAKSTIASKIVTNDITNPTFTVVPTDYVNFAPWYLSGSTDSNGALNGKLSNSGTLTVGETGADFTSIKDAIDAAVVGTTIKVMDSRTYLETLNVDRSLTLVAETTATPTVSGGMTIAADGVSVSGFTFTNPSGTYGVYSEGRSGISITNNTFVNIGTSADHAQAIYFKGAVSNITITDNHISNVGNILAGAYSSKGIFFGDSDGSGVSSNLVISNNVISGVYTTPDHKGAYGILINYGASSTGVSNGVQVSGNTIGELHGSWSTAIGLEGRTPSASVTDNNVSGVLGVVGVSIEANPSPETITINRNNFGSTVTGVHNQVENSTVKAEGNWWGAGMKSTIKVANKFTTGTVDFDPWYLNEEKTQLSSTDTTGPVVVLSTDDADGIVKAETDKTVTITANITDATTGIDGIPKITIANGGVSGVEMTAGTGNNWTYSWTVPAGDVTATISVEAFDYVGHGVSSTTGITGLIVDNTVPTFTVNDGTETGPVKTDTIKITITEANGIAESKYGFSTADMTCDASDTFGSDFISGMEFGIAGNNVDYLCAMAKDAAGNISYLPVGRLNTDNAAPVLTEVTPIATPGKITTPTYAFTSSEAGTITYSGGCSSSTAMAISGDNTIVFAALNDGTYNNCKIKVTDAATNATELDVSDFVVDTTAPKIINLTPDDTATTLLGTPTIGAQFEETGSGILESSIIFQLAEDVDADHFAIKNSSGVSFTPVNSLGNGNFHATVTVSDKVGNTSTKSWIFIVNRAVSDLTLSSSENSLPADGASVATITAVATSNNKPASGVTVNFSKTIGVLSSASAITNAEGKATVTLTSSTSGYETVTASYGAGSEMVWKSVTIDFTKVIVDTTPPTATSSPADDATGIAVNVSPVITFSEEVGAITGTNVQLRKYDTTAEIAASLTTTVEDGKTIVTINPESDLDNNTSYYFYISSVKDLAKNSMISWTSTNQNSHSFKTIAAHVPVTSVDISLKSGWNLISLPLIPTSNKTVDIISSISSKVNIVQYYDDTAGWVSYSPTAGVAGLEKMEDGKGYWIDMKEATTLTITGTEMPLPGSSMPLYKIKKGWNLIGFKSVSEMKSSSYLGTGVDYVVVYGFDGTSNSYPTVAYPSSDSSQKTDNYMKPGLGYWLYAKDEGYIVPVIK